MKFKTYNIDETRLQRNYLENPIKITPNGVGSERLNENELQYLYIELNMMIREIANFVGVKISNVEKWLHRYNIKKDLESIAKNNVKSCMEKYNLPNAGWTEESQKKIRETNMNIFGTMFPGGLPQFLEKAQNTKLEKYGDPFYFDKEKQRQTNLERYGVENPLQSKEIQLKCQQGKMRKYGDPFYFDKEKQRQTNLERYGTEYPQSLEVFKEKQRQTNLERYGVIYYTQTDEWYEKYQKTSLERYGVNFYVQSDEYKNKVLQLKNEKYGRNHESQVHYSDETFNILISSEMLKEYILSQDIKTYINLSSKLGITPTTLRNYVVKYDLQDLIDIDNNESSYEQELQLLYPFLERHNRKILNGKEIDLYNEEHKLGIEFNGNFYHNEYGKDKNYHQEKSLLAEEKGIFIYHIFEYEWNTKREQILNQINNLLGINQNKIYARKCIIKEVDNKEKNNFLELNHLQGNDRSLVKMGLYYQDVLVSIMTFCKPRFNKKYEWELSRFCSKAGCNVIGGASKLFKYFITNYQPQSIISYSNIAHTKGNLYNMLGFKLNKISEPNYVWCKGLNDIKSRYQCQKYKLLKEGYEGNTEVDIMHDLGYYRIYDCGNKVWVWNNIDI